MVKKKAEVTMMYEMAVGTGELAAIIGKSGHRIRQMTGDGILKQVGDRV